MTIITACWRLIRLKNKWQSISLILFLITLSGCNLPRPAQPSATPDLVATQVATLLMGMPTANLDATITPPPPTATAPSASLTPLPSQTSTISPDDPVTTLGQPTYRDTFAKASLWGLEDPYDDGHTRVEIHNNSLILTSLNAEGWLGWRTTFPEPGDAYIEAVFSTGLCSGGDQYGLVFRSSEDTAGFFGITCDGRFGLIFNEEGQFTRLLNWQNTTAIHTGSNQTNRLGVWSEGSKIRLYANGTLLTEIQVDHISKQGNFGAFIAGINTSPFSINVTEISYWERK